MTGEKIFLDTNIVIYNHSKQDIKKQKIVREIILGNDYIISTHVVDEFYNICNKKLKYSIAETNKKTCFLLDNYPIVPVHDYTDKTAIYFQEKYGYYFFDCLMLASALEYKCKYIITEDMQHGHFVENKLIILNPFK